MSPKRLIVELTAAVLLVWANRCMGQTQPDCLSYEPAIVTLRGTLVRKTFPGPPDYESVKNGDRPETYWLLELPRPVCVNDDSKGFPFNIAMRSVHAIQLVLKPEVYKQRKNLVGQKVVATGTLYGEHTGHHHTPVLLTVRSLQQLSDRD